MSDNSESKTDSKKKIEWRCLHMYDKLAIKLQPSNN